jgi:hypothetical protein
MRFPASRHHDRLRGRGPGHPMAASQDFFSAGDETRSSVVGGMMTRRTRNLLLAALVPVIVVVVGASLFWPSSSTPRNDAFDATQQAAPAAKAPTPAPSTAPTADRKTYAIPVPELAGLAATAAPGTRLELWVAWEPPITKSPKVQRLLKDVTLEKIVPPSVPEAPATAILSLPEAAVPDLLYGDRYGALSVTMSS